MTENTSIQKSSNLISRSVQILIVAFFILLLFPLFCLIAVFIKISSSGPIFYISQRKGRGSVDFSIYKFRTMNTHSADGEAITGPNDPRITPLGRALRNSKMDELPQLFNILLGDMNFIGPRPESPYIVDQYYNEDMRKTLNVKPGLTGKGTLLYMQRFKTEIDPTRPTESYVEYLLADRLTADLTYIENRTFLNDCSIFAQTILFMFARLFKSSIRE